jgi:hypothetical protein
MIVMRCTRRHPFAAGASAIELRTSRQVFSIDLCPFDRSPPMACCSAGVSDRPTVPYSWDIGPPMRGLRDSRRWRAEMDAGIGKGMSLMPVADPSFGWLEAAGAFGLVIVVAFAVTWIVTDLARVSRTPYIAVLTVTTLVLGVGYVAWSGTKVADLVTEDWGWGIAGGIAAMAVVVPLVRRLPSGPRPEGSRLVGRLLWEGVVYGMAEALLLATLPVLALWQGAEALGWTDPGVGAITSGALAIVGALIVIAVHHLGYREFRRSRKMMAGALAACGIQALAFLLTGNVLAPILAHIVLHGQLTLRGDEMPPSRASQEPGRAGRLTTVERFPRRKELVA